MRDFCVLLLLLVCALCAAARYQNVCGSSDVFLGRCIHHRHHVRHGFHHKHPALGSTENSLQDQVSILDSNAEEKIGENSQDDRRRVKYYHHHNRRHHSPHFTHYGPHRTHPPIYPHRPHDRPHIPHRRFHHLHTTDSTIDKYPVTDAYSGPELIDIRLSDA